MKTDYEKQIKVLIVDDEEGIREYLAMAVEDITTDVKFAENSIEGLMIYKEFLPDLVISDMMMPGGSGDGLIKQIRAMDGSRPKIILTSGYSHLSPEQVKELGADLLIAKPFFLDEMCKEIKSLLNIK